MFEFLIHHQFLLLIVLTLALSACAATHYTVHPGAINTADSVSYDTLLIAETAIDNARSDYQAGRLPDSTKPAFNTLVRTYNVAHETWLTYRDAIAANQPADTYLSRLNENLTALNDAILQFREAQ